MSGGGIMQRFWARAGTAYRAKVGKELTAHGLMYEDALVETEEVKLALSRLPAAVFNAREQRLKRAMVLSSQQKTLPPDVAAQIDPFESYLGALGSTRRGREMFACGRAGRVGDDSPIRVREFFGPSMPRTGKYLEAVEKEKQELLSS